MLTNSIAHNFFIQKSLFEIIFSPFVDLADYFMRFDNYGFQISAWLGWMLFAGCLISLIRKKSAFIIFKFFLLFWFLVIFVLFFRYSGNHIVSKNPDKILVDYHSHTRYSWDGMASIDRSLNYHKANGFDAYAITEHDFILPEAINVDVFNKPNYPVVIFGEELRDQNIYHLVHHVSQSIDANLLQHDINKIRSEVDKSSGVISAALWWEHSKFQDIINKPIDAYEIANMGHRIFDKKEYTESVQYAKKHNIPVIGSTDWHGWGYRATIWTVLTIPDWKDMTYEKKQTALVDTLKGKYQTTVLEHTRYNEIKNNFRYAFEPLFGLFYLLTAKDFISLCFWVIWIFLTILFIKFITRKNIEYLFWLISGTGILLFGIKLFFIWQAISQYNKSLRNVAIFFAIIGILSIITSIFTRKSKCK